MNVDAKEKSLDLTNTACEGMRLFEQDSLDTEHDRIQERYDVNVTLADGWFYYLEFNPFDIGVPE